jgi:hypothetical protein
MSQTDCMRGNLSLIYCSGGQDGKSKVVRDHALEHANSVIKELEDKLEYYENRQCGTCKHWEPDKADHYDGKCLKLEQVLSAHAMVTQRRSEFVHFDWLQSARGWGCNMHEQKKKKR